MSENTVLEDATATDKRFLSNLTESAAAGTYSVRTATDDGVAVIDSCITLVNGQGVGATFSFGHTADPLGEEDMFNDHECVHLMEDDVVALLNFVANWGLDTLGAIHAFMEATDV